MNPPPGVTSMAGLVQDLRYALRALRRDLGFFLFAALIVGLGIGATTAVFSVMSPLLLKPLPFHEPEELVWVANQRTGGMSARTSRASNLRDFRAMNESFEALTGYFAFFEYESYNLSGDGPPERLVGVGVAQDFLPTLGIDPLVGRNFVDEESVGDGRRAAILTHGFWTRRYAADPGIVGRSIVLNDEPTDPLTFVSMVAILLFVAGLAGFLPARRASRTDPIAALRAE